MQVFLSWSGSLSEQLAEQFRTWIPSTIQTVKPYFSPKDIEKGARWSTEITSKLNNSSVCIIFLTRDNLNSNWIMFEAGAISKSVDTSKVCPILFNVDPTDLQGPLSQFQATKFGKSEIKKLFNTINSSSDGHKLSDDVADSVFEKWWPDLDEGVAKILSAHIETAKRSKEIRTDRALIEEILLITREISNNKIVDLSITDITSFPITYEITTQKAMMNAIIAMTKSVILSKEESDKLNSILINLSRTIRASKLPPHIQAAILADARLAKSTMQIMPEPRHLNNSDMDDDIPF